MFNINMNIYSYLYIIYIKFIYIWISNWIRQIVVGDSANFTFNTRLRMSRTSAQQMHGNEPDDTNQVQDMSIYWSHCLEIFSLLSF